MFQGRLTCLLFLRLLRKQQKFEMCSVKHIWLLYFNEQVRVYTSIFDPINLTDCDAGVSPLSLAVGKIERNVGVGQEVSLATPERFNIGNSPQGGPCCFVFSWAFLRGSF